MNLKKKRWGILVVCCLINLCIGSIYAFSVFSVPFAARLTEILGREITAADLAIVFTVTNFVGPITMILGGSINDKLGPRWVVFVGGLLFGGGMLLSGYVTSIGMLVVTFGLMLGLAMGLVYGCTVSNSIKFFPDKRGLIGGIAVASYGLSSAVMPPIANTLIEANGISSAVTILGIVILVVVCVGAFFIPQCPPNYVPEGWTPPVPKKSEAPSKDMNWKQMLSMPIFYVMLFMLLCGAFSGLMVTSQAKPIGMEMIGLDSLTATSVVSVLALFNTGGRVIGGVISDRIGRINTCSLMFVTGVFGLLCLFFAESGSAVLFYIGICIIGLTFGSFMGVFPGFTADQFGTKNNSVNYGIMFFGFSIAGTFGPMIMSSLYKSSGSYGPAFLVATALGIVGFAMTFVFRAMKKSSSVKIITANESVKG